MSRAYRVTVKGSVHRVVHVEDGVCTELELLPILPRERLAQILAAELGARGFTGEGAVKTRIEEDGVIVEVDVETGKVTVKAEASARISVERERTERIVEERLETDRLAAQERAQLDAERAAKDAEAKAQAEVSQRLERRLSDLRRELDAVTTRTTAEALKQKARQIGEIEEMHEDAESGELTIKVRL